MTFWTDFQAAIDNFVKQAKAVLVTIANKIKPLAVATAEDLAQEALNAVIQEAPKVITGQEKFNNAVSSVMTNLAAKGKSAGVALVETSVQTAYNTISAQLNNNKAN